MHFLLTPQEKLEDAPSENSYVRMSRRMDTSSTTQMAQIMTNIEDLVVRLKRNLYGHPLAGLLWERQFEPALAELGWEKVPNWKSLFVHRKQGLFLSVYVEDITMAGKKQNMAPVWKNMMQNVAGDEPTSFLDHVNLGCTRRECKPNESIIEQKNDVRSRISSRGPMR